MYLKEFLLIVLITIVNVKSQEDQEQEVEEAPAFVEAAEEYKKGKCYRPADFFYRQCCVFPPFYSRVVAVECGARTIVNFYDKKENITAATRVMTDNDCAHWRCVLKKYKQLDGDIVDMDKYYRHLYKWADLNPKFKGVITQAQGRANEVFRMRFPLDVCSFIDINNFIRFFVTLDCPALIPTPECYDQKQVYHDCREYFLV